MLERMRIIDQANAWSLGTHRNCQALLGKLCRFETSYGLPLLQPTALQHPPRHPSTGVMWAQQQYTLQTASTTHTQSGESILYGTARALRSAASQFYLWDRQIAYPERALRDPQSRKVYLAAGVSPTDTLGYGLMSTGMSKRMGDESKPPIALTLRQILWIMGWIEKEWVACVTTAHRTEVAAAAVVNLFEWLGWLRSQELFSLTWADLRITRPRDGPRLGLPVGVGVLELRLLPETKSNRTKVADVVMSYACASGLQPGLWIERLRQLWPTAPPHAFIICGHDGTPWTSQYFRQHHLYVWLRQMRADGDPFLQAFTNAPGHRIEDKYYSFGTY